VALLQLAARGQDVNEALPRIMRQLEYNDNLKLWRRHAWDALRFVFFDETEAIADYNPMSSAEDCRAKVARLRKILGQAT
jgi:hypothetical protein